MEVEKDQGGPTYNEGIFSHMAWLSLEDAQWIPEANWLDPKRLKTSIKQDRPTKETSKPSTL